MVNNGPLRLAVLATASSLGLLLTQPPVAVNVRQPLAVVLFLVCGALLVSVLRGQASQAVRRLAGGCFGLSLISVLPSPSEAMAVLQAWSAQVLFAGVHVLVLMLSPRWQKGPNIVEDGGFPSLRSLSRFAVVVVLIQVALGAAYRHGLASLPFHVLGAILATMILLLLASFVIVQFPSHAPLTRASWSLIAVITVQIALGIFAYIGRVGQPEGIAPSGSFRASTIAHIAFAALTLAATTSLASLVQYHVRPRAALEPGLRAVS